MACKYLKGGALNPSWCDEQDSEEESSYVMDSIALLYEMSKEMDLNMSVDFQLEEGVVAHLSKNNETKDDACSPEDIEAKLEAKFNFIRNHNDTPEDLELAIKIIESE